MRHNKKWIRIYVNGEKVRSTGNEKWYRDTILRDLQVPIFSANSKKSGNEWDSFTMKELDRTAFVNAVTKKGVVPWDSISRNRLDWNHTFFNIRIELVTARSGKKIVIGEFVVPFMLRWPLDLGRGGEVSPVAVMHARHIFPSRNTEYIKYPLSKNEFTLLYKTKNPEEE